MDIDIHQLAAEIEADKQPHEITPRQLLNAFGFERRTSGNCQVVDKFLNDHSLAVNPHYNDVWVDEPISLEHKPLATTCIPADYIRRINVLDSATNIPTYVNVNASLLEATTLMQCNIFSQLPVTHKGAKGLEGYISWETIAKAIINGVHSEYVRDYMSKDVSTLSPDTPFIKAVGIVLQHDFAVVIARDNSLFGIVTVSDITSQFIEETEAFVLLNEIENHLRKLMGNKILLEALQALCQCNPVRPINSIDDLTFGDYVTVFGNEEQWNKLNIRASRKAFIDVLNQIREIRNDVMHFRPGGISKEKRRLLRCLIGYLRTLAKIDTQDSIC